VLPKIDTPLSNLFHVLKLKAQRPRKASTSQGSGAPIEAKLETLCMKLIDNGLDATGPFVGVRHELIVGASLSRGPAVINVYITISDFLESKIREIFGRF
jgi:hypothetical protein